MANRKSTKGQTTISEQENQRDLNQDSQIPLRINTTGTTSGAGTAYPSGAPEFTPGF
jgi:hypothetical protein